MDGDQVCTFYACDRVSDRSFCWYLEVLGMCRPACESYRLTELQGESYGEAEGEKGAACASFRTSLLDNRILTLALTTTLFEGEHPSLGRKYAMTELGRIHVPVRIFLDPCAEVGSSSLRRARSTSFRVDIQLLHGCYDVRVHHLLHSGFAVRARRW